MVGTGEKKALCMSSISPDGCSARLRTLPALELRRLLFLFMLPLRLSTAFFFRVPVRDGTELSPWIALERCIGLSNMELPRWLASHSSLNRPWFRSGRDCDSGDEAVGLPGGDPKSGATVKDAGCERGVLAGPYPLSRCAWKGEGTGVELRAAMVL